MPNETAQPTGDSLPHVFFHHNLWSNLRLFDVCLTLNDDQLEHSDPGAYGSIRATMDHLVRAEEYYLFELKGRDAAFGPKPDALDTLAGLKERARRSGDAMIQVAVTLPAGAQVLVGEGDEVESLPATALLLQSIHHAHEHRTQVNTLLGQLGIDPPHISGWRYYDEVLAPAQ